MHRMIQSEQQKEGSDACLFSKIGLIMNPDKPEAVNMAGMADSFFQSHGIRTVFLQNGSHDVNGTDLILTFGGDGTFLIGARTAMEHDIPLMGINLGTVGFLTEEEPGHLAECLTSILNGQYNIEERFLLCVTTRRNNESYYALNDAVITRGGYARLIRVDVTVDRKEYCTFTADGLIVATPTGSTGYSLSAGGPIVEPGMNCMIITPVCPHSMQHCPCIVSEKADIRLLLKPEREQTAELQIDGQNMGSLSAGDEIHVTGTDRKISLIRLHPYDFFGLTRRKLSEWGS